jgi:threonine synthase
VPATALRCRICETQIGLDPVGVCGRCFGPLDPVYDRDEQRRTVSRESIAAGPPSIWRA